MELDEIKKHWDANAKNNKTKLLSTTKTATIKQLEIDAFAREIQALCDNKAAKCLLEVGCGNGHNLFGLAELFPNFKFEGVDYSEEMVEAAQNLNKNQFDSKISFDVADVLKLEASVLDHSAYDFVITDRMLINLNSWDLQKNALQKLFALLKPNGYLILIENFTTSYRNQNELREIIGLPPRIPDAYNKFINENDFEIFIKNNLNAEIMVSKNFASLHDILLYVLLPHFNAGKVSYDHPVMESVTQLLINLPDELSESFGQFGQNNLYVLKRP
jgi:SAM-dependent methyltransferase